MLFIIGFVTERTKTIAAIVAMVVVLGSYMGIGYCVAINRRPATPVITQP